MSGTVSFAEAVAHSRVIIDGYTGIMFQDRATNPFEFAEATGKPCSALWSSEPVKIIQGVMKFLAASVRLQVTGFVVADDEPATEQSSVSADQRHDFRLRAAFIFTRHDGNEFLMGRELSFRGPYFRHFD